MRRVGLVSSAAACLAFAVPALPSQAAERPGPAEPYGGFATEASATPLRIEIHEPAIPVPAEPQAELNFSYTKVQGSSGPSAKARASAMWPGAAVGEGLKTIVEQAGLPPQLGAQGYPVQVNAALPSDVTSASQEVFPGMIQRVNTTESHAVARAGYSTDGKVPGDENGEQRSDDQESPDGEGEAEQKPAPQDPLDALMSGDLTALGGLLTGTAEQGPDDDPAAPAPLGALSLLVSADGMGSSSRTDYSSDSTVTASATSRIGRLSLAAGIVQLYGLDVTTVATSSLAGGTTEQKVSYGGMTIAGTPFELTSEGIEAAGNTTAIPGLPDAPLKALEALGITITLPKPEKSVEENHATVTASGPTITVDTAPLLSRLPKLPLDQITSQLPDQAGQLKGLLLALGEAHPKVVIVAGRSTSEARAVAGIDPSGGDAPATGDTPSSADTPPAAAGGGGVPASGGGGIPAVDTGAAPAATADAPAQAPAVNPVSAVPGLPPLGSVPGLLTIGAIALGAGTGWWMRRAAGVLFGGAGTCPHGLESGLPDLRKV